MFSEEVLKKVEAPSTGALPLMLTSEDGMFSVMRDINFRAVGNFLSSKAKDISALFAVSVHDNPFATRLILLKWCVCVFSVSLLGCVLHQSRHDAKTVSQLKTFVDKLPHMQEQKLNLSKREPAVWCVLWDGVPCDGVWCVMCVVWCGLLISIVSLCNAQQIQLLLNW